MYTHISMSNRAQSLLLEAFAPTPVERAEVVTKLSASLDEPAVSKPPGPRRLNGEASSYWRAETGRGGLERKASDSI